jgi:hypothetical protein
LVRDKDVSGDRKDGDRSLLLLSPSLVDNDLPRSGGLACDGFPCFKDFLSVRSSGIGTAKTLALALPLPFVGYQRREMRRVRCHKLHTVFTTT